MIYQIDPIAQLAVAGIGFVSGFMRELNYRGNVLDDNSYNHVPILAGASPYIGLNLELFLPAYYTAKSSITRLKYRHLYNKEIAKP